MALTRIGLNQSINLASNVTGTLPTGNGGTGATSFTAGKGLQFVQGTSQTRTATSSQTFVDTAVTVDITPSATSSKIFITAHNQLYASNNPTNRPALGLKRDSTLIWVPSADSGPKYYQFYAEDGQSYILPVALTYLDSPSTTSQITYKQAIASYSGSSVEDIGGVPSYRYKAVITAMEIAS